MNTSGTAVLQYTYDAWGNILTKSGSLASINPFRYRSYYFDEQMWFYYLESRYYDPAIGRFINADVFASTGQGVLGYNMFAYCGNNPVNRCDPSGKSYIDWDLLPNYEAGKVFAEWFLNTDENGRDENGELTNSAKAKRLCILAWDSLEFSCGIGVGFEFSKDLLDLAALSGGLHGDLLPIRLEDGEFSVGQDYNSGFSFTAFFQNVGYVESSYNKNFKQGEMEYSKGLWGDETWTIWAESFYLGLGGQIRIGFDSAFFFTELFSIFE